VNRRQWEVIERSNSSENRLTTDPESFRGRRTRKDGIVEYWKDGIVDELKVEIARSSSNWVEVARGEFMPPNPESFRER
jgi:hypothetical protein